MCLNVFNGSRALLEHELQQVLGIFQNFRLPAPLNTEHCFGVKFCFASPDNACVVTRSADRLEVEFLIGTRSNEAILDLTEGTPSRFMRIGTNQ